MEKVAGEMDEIVLLLSITLATEIACAESAAVVLKLKLPLRELI